jgi:PTH1 family peptidyl-tRNA hydrolase
MALFSGRERRGTPYDWLIVGLGNPGKEYARSRHNVGAEAVHVVAERHGTTLKAGRDSAAVGTAVIADRRCVLAFPLTYMNESGRSVAGLVRRHGITDPERIVIVQDELDLPPAVVRVKVGGGLAGHNGLRSIAQHLKTHDFVRVRIGVGKPPSKEHGAKHVLHRVPKVERESLDVAVQEAADAVEAIVGEGVEAAMNRFNTAR